MTQALRVISIQRGFDPREFTLVCFGGAGGLHFCDLAEALEMTRAIVPINSGVLSALGMLATSPGREIARTHKQLLADSQDADIQLLFSELKSQGELELEEEGASRLTKKYSMDLRYLGQTFTLPVSYNEKLNNNLGAAEAQFHEQHESRYGHRLDKPVEILNLRVHLEAPVPDIKLPILASRVSTPESLRVDLPGFGEIPVFEREQLSSNQQFDGPALITERHATTLIKENWKVLVDQVGNLILEKKAT
jgi:N-methylhydantoinase A